MTVMSAVEVLFPQSPPMTSSQKQPIISFVKKPSASTPNDSPASFPGSSSLGSRKRVEFSDRTNIHNSAAFHTSSINSSSIRPLPPSRECQSSRSILKIKEEDASASYGVDSLYQEHRSMNEIMESVVQQLSRDDKATSLDAYQTLAAAVKVYDEIPEEAVLKNKLLTIVKFIKRDLCVLDKPDAQPTDSNLVTQALKVLVIIVWSNVFSPLLTDDVRGFILDRSLQVISEHTAPKSVIIHYLHLLATQSFRPGLLASNNRASRLLDALKSVTEHVKGNGAVSERLLVYQKLIDQARSTMKSRAHYWIEEMLSALASSVSDTRAKALSLGRKACQAFLASSSISHSVRAGLDRELDTGRTLGTTICRKLEIMVTKKEDAVQVPQVWAVVLLLCNGLDNKIDSWPALKDWLKVIQRCFNSSDSAVRQQANMAWNRFVYIVRPHEASESLVSMLAKPIIAQVERHASDKAGKNSQTAAVSSYCNLLYYSFRPAATHKQYTRVWNQYIVKVMRTTFFEKHPPNADTASRILMALFWDPRTTPKVWNESRAHENTLIAPEELPTIDCKWTRTKCSAILEIFVLLFKYSSWGLSGSSDQAYVSKAWKHFLKAVREAGAKEVKSSVEARNAIASILELVSDLWEIEDGSHSFDDLSDSVFRRDVLHNITQTAISELGVLALLEAIETSQRKCSLQLLMNVWEVVTSTTNFDKMDEIRAPQHDILRRVLLLCDDTLARAYHDFCQTQSYLIPNAAIGLMMQVLLRLPAGFLAFGFQGIGSSLSLWLADEQHALFSTTQAPLKSNDTINEAVHRMGDLVGKCILRSEGDALVQFDQVIATALKSAHHSIVCTTVSALGEVVANKEGSALGALITIALQDLKNDANLVLPKGLYNMLPSDQHSSHFKEFDHVDHQRMQEPSRSIEETEEADVQDFVHPTSTDARNPLTHHDRNSSAKRKHNDSQIEFVSIESSPPTNHEIESQYLTDRQKEIRDRRRIEPAVVFPDLRSSPKSLSRPHSRARSRHSETPDCNFARKAAAMNERPSTPVLTDLNDAEVRDIAPSPTPKARHFSQRLLEPEIPSSPPSILDHGDKKRPNLEDLSSPLQEATTGQDDVDVDLALCPAAAADDTQMNEPTDQMEEVEAGPATATEEKATPKENIIVEAVERIDQETHSPVTEPAIEGTVSTANSEDLQGVDEKEDHRAESSLPINIGTDSDEMDELSASQLSHDLDWHVSYEERLSAAPSLATDAAGNDETAQNQTLQADLEEVKNKRKRPSTSKNNRASIKKRRRTVSRSVSLSSQDVEPAIVADELLTTEKTVATPMPHACMVATGASIIVARPAEDLVEGAVEPEVDVRENIPYNVEEGVELTIHTPTQASPKSQAPLTECMPSVAAATSADLFQAMVQEEVHDIQEQQEVRHVSEIAEEPLPAPIGIVASLQAVLEQVTKAPPSAVDLRSIDELCFQIRFQAQFKAQLG